MELKQEELCRTCLGINNPQFSLFSIYNFPNEEIMLSTLLENCTSVQVEKTSFLTTICCECVNKLTTSYLFKQRCQEVDKQLRKIEADTLIKEQTNKDDVTIKLHEKIKSDDDDDEEVENECDIRDIMTVEQLLSNCPINLDDIDNINLQDFSPSNALNEEDEGKVQTTTNKENDTKISCNVCDKEFYDEGNLIPHLGTHGAEKPGAMHLPSKCEATKTAMERPEKVTHDDGEPSHCKDGDFFNLTTIIMPMSMPMSAPTPVTEAVIEAAPLPTPIIKEKRALLCPTCGKLFKSAFNLKIHIKRHNGEKSYQCNVCSMRFVTKGHLTSHARVHTGERPFSCNICGMTFAQTSVIGRHMKIHTGELNHTCPICNKSFSTQYSLNIHRRVHTGEKPEECEQCFKKFADPKVLKRHRALHNNGKQYSNVVCGVCGMSFTKPADLKMHAKQHLHS